MHDKDKAIRKIKQKKETLILAARRRQKMNMRMSGCDEGDLLTKNHGKSHKSY